MRVDITGIAATRLLIHSRGTERCDIWGAAGDARRDAVPWEEPRLVVIGCPLGHIDAAADTIQTVAVIIRNGIVVKGRATARIPVQASIAVRLLKSRRLPCSVDRAIRARVKRD